MSKYLFSDSITLYTPDKDGFERQVITSVKAEVTDLEGGEREAVLYIPIYGKRFLKFVSSDSRPYPSDCTFTVKDGQRIALGVCPDPYPPSSAFFIEKTEYFFNGSKRMRHLRVYAHNTKNSQAKEAVPL